MVEVVEQYLMSKSGDERGGEDRLILGPHFYGVVDGATDKTGHNWGSEEHPERGGAVLANIIKRTFERADGTKTPEQLVATVNTIILATAESRNIDLCVPKNRAIAVCAVYAPQTRSVYHIGDCPFGFHYANGKFTVTQSELAIDSFLAAMRSQAIRWFFGNGINPLTDDRDLGREFVTPYLERQGELVNSNQEGVWFAGIPFAEFAYHAINGFPTELTVTKVPEDVEEVALATDGFPFVRPTLEETERYRAEAVKSDSHGIHEHKRVKGIVKGNMNYDDMAYLRLRI